MKTASREYQSGRRALVLFTSHPSQELYRKGLGSDYRQSQQIYRALLKHTLQTACQAREQLHFDIVIVSDEIDAPNLRHACAALPATLPLHFMAHCGNRFSEKFASALQRTFQRHYREVVIIGNDCLDLSPQTLQEAFQRLEGSDVVLGPAADGGFYLLGLNHFDQRLLDDICWCTPAVFGQIRGNIGRLGLKLHTLAALSDIDSGKDLRSWLCSRRGTEPGWIFLILISILNSAVSHHFHYRPFLSKNHLNKRSWQLPPPCTPAFATLS